VAELLRATADAWNAGIERWTYVAGTALARECGVDGYYVRIAPPDVGDEQPASGGRIPIKNRPIGEHEAPYTDIVSVDALALVRFGLRDPHDPRIVNTVKVIDAKLRVRTETGPAWYRYNQDGYGEKADGSPFDVVGVGRPWPLLAGERAHYELAAGHPEVALQLLGVMRAQASDGGMLPEQVWDGPDLKALELFNGRASGGAMPLVWAHAEYAKLVRSLHDGRVFDMPQQTYERYVRTRRVSEVTVWAAHNRSHFLCEGCTLRIQTPVAATVVWTLDGATDQRAVATRETPLPGVWLVDIGTAALPAGTVLRFTIRTADGGQDGGYAITVVARPSY
jgi:glucoamylase